MTQSTAKFYPLLPLLLFLCVFVGSGMYFMHQGVPMAFYQISPNMAILPAIVLSLFFARKGPGKGLDTFLEGVRDQNIIIMCLIYLLAGAFSEVTKEIGSVQASINFGISWVPSTFMLPGIFIVSAFLATAMGTSMGTIATVTPIAVGLATHSGLSIEWCVGAVISGAMFGDNLSPVSDTTIASVATQGASMKEKLILNAQLAIPAMLLTVGFFYFLSNGSQEIPIESYDIWLVVPYILIFAMALAGVNVMVVLTTGIATAALLGFWSSPDYSFVILSKQMTQGFASMQEILILSLLIGGLSLLMNEQGGLLWLVRFIEKWAGIFSKKTMSRRVGELSMSFLTALIDACTANNTVALIISGPVAKNLAHRHQISPHRAACLIDIFSCVIQGLLPYSAQLLLASSIAKVSPIDLISTVIYCPILGVMTLLSIAVGFHHKKKGNLL